MVGAASSNTPPPVAHEGVASKYKIDSFGGGVCATLAATVSVLFAIGVAID